MHSDKTTDSTLMPKRYLAGILLLFAAAGLWSLSGALIKLIHQDGHGPGGVTIAFYRSLFAGLFVLPLARGKLHTLRSRHTSPRLRERPFLSALLRSPLTALRPAALWCIVFFTLMTVSFVVANTKTEAAGVIVLQYTSTFWVFSLSPWILQEKPKLHDRWILGLALVGIAIIFMGNAATDFVGLTVALASGLFYALLTLMIRLMRDADSAAIVAVNTLGSALLLFPVVLLAGDLRVSPHGLFLLVVLGVVQFGLPYYFYSLGLARIPAYQAALITMAELVINPVWAYLVIGEVVPPATFLGGAAIVLALLLFLRTVRL